MSPRLVPSLRHSHAAKREPKSQSDQDDRPELRSPVKREDAEIIQQQQHTQGDQNNGSQRSASGTANAVRSTRLSSVGLSRPRCRSASLIQRHKTCDRSRRSIGRIGCWRCRCAGMSWLRSQRCSQSETGQQCVESKMIGQRLAELSRLGRGVSVKHHVKEPRHHEQAKKIGLIRQMTQHRKDEYVYETFGKLSVIKSADTGDKT